MTGRARALLREMTRSLARSNPLFVWVLVSTLAFPKLVLADPEGTAIAVVHVDRVEELERLLASLDGGDAQAARAISELGEGSVAAISNKLAELRRTPAAPVMAAVKSVRTTDAGDLFDALLARSHTEPGAKAALYTVALLRALAHASTAAAARELVNVAVDAHGAFRPEIARLVKIVGERAVPALIQVRKNASPDVRQWATTQLEALGKRIPGDAVQTPNHELLSEVLRAYGATHDLDALPVLLSFVNSDRGDVRTAAREAVLALDQDALWKLREAYANVLAKAAPEGLAASDVANALFAAYDRLRLHEVYGLLDAGLSKYSEGDLAAAVADFDKVLARQPQLDRRGETVPAYVAMALQLEEAEPLQALEILRKAERLAPRGPRASQVNAEIAYLEGVDLLGRGIPDPKAFERALSLDPSHKKARIALDRLASKADEGQSRTLAAGGSMAALLLLVVAWLLFGGIRRVRPLS